MSLITCPACGNSVSERATSCPRCGEPIAAQSGNTKPVAAPATEPVKDYVAFDFDRKSYLKKQSNDDPAEVERVMCKWNWGAFGLTWIWGVGNGTFWTLLLLIPGLGWIAYPFLAIYLGIKGNHLAWNSRDKEWENIDEFRRIQRYWAIATFVKWALLVVAAVIIIVIIKSIPPEGIVIDAEDVVEGAIKRRFWWLEFFK